MKKKYIYKKVKDDPNLTTVKFLALQRMEAIYFECGLSVIHLFYSSSSFFIFIFSSSFFF